VTVDAVIEVLSVLEGARCRAWIARGWGVDALADRQTREHRDLDLTINADDEPTALAVLAQLG
jgi:lincosamide nucleotidyltransferase A/C/D/E